MVYNYKNARNWKKGISLGIIDSGSFFKKFGTSTIVVENDFVRKEDDIEMNVISINNINHLMNISILIKSLKSINKSNELDLLPLYQSIYFLQTDLIPKQEDTLMFFNTLLELQTFKNSLDNIIEVDLVSMDYCIELKMLGLSWRQIMNKNKYDKINEIEDQYFKLKIDVWEKGEITTSEFITEAKKLYTEIK
mgnify:CR=1 FL=1